MATCCLWLLPVKLRMMVFHISTPSCRLFQRTSFAVRTVQKLWNLNLHLKTAGLCALSGPGSLCKSEELYTASTEKPPHVPVMLKEVLHYLDIQPGQVVLDMTFGGGGHTKAILKAVSDATVLALDRDPTAISLAQELAKENPFSDMPCAADVVNTLDHLALASILSAYGEERHARKIASAIVESRRVNPITRTQQLASVVAGSFPAAAIYARKDRLHRPAHVATKTFQALRIFVNDELNELHAGLRTARTALKSGGRLCVITFHSLEDRLVKRFLQGDDLSNLEQYHFGLGRQGVGREKSVETKKDRASVYWHPLQKKVITPEKADIKENARARSAKLRVALRC
ncbi:probable methyltransferase-like protein 15 isoform X3 [Phyllopteryx taeniolatus]|uniref:probable methyltransferase-like protein 15 isoform X3 n=1 Tax=Phyllopteryx taeniolatus TaxID=161469 RepID=UPI002AD59021|nr:probable methyltransferase-like protein 15 isoform X3 [Phyllopteryx taeniolatus]